MAIVAGDIDFHLSGGAANADPNASLGGARSSEQITSAVLNNLFDDVSGEENAAGDVEYRCIYVRNAHGSLTLENARFWIGTETPSGDSVVDVGLDPAGLNGTATTVAGEDDAPAGVTFSHPLSKAEGLDLGGIPPGQHYPVWVRRTISAGGSAFNNDGPTFRVGGDTQA